jgi:ferredoxin-type protein NapG
MANPRQIEARRKFLRSLGLGIGVLGVSSLGFIPIANSQTLRLRPPGALEEKEFLASCIKCGQCVQVCPVQAVVLADIFDGFGLGVPFIDARKQACDFSCDALQCILACPTGALSHELSKPEQVRMGFARLALPEKCLAMQGKGFKGTARGTDFKGKLRYSKINRWKPIPIREHPYDLELCDLCVRECPIPNAIKLVSISENKSTPIIEKTCVGCGVCEMMCPTDPPAIIIEARKTGATV